jgi:aryl-alcohol dehydrogenase-like predicted oxidoreductase
MKTRTLRTGIALSEIGLGCWAIGGPFWDRGGWMGYGDCDDAESVRCLRRAAELGVTFFDTADVYGCGHSEQLVGDAFAGRTDVVISTKFGFTFDESARKVTGTDATPAAIRSSLEASLRRLRRERIDLYSFQLWDHPLEKAGEVLDTLEALVAEGKVRSYCWLTDDIERVRFFANGPHCAGTGQLLNVLEHNDALIALCEELKLPILARRPLGMGLLTGKFTPATQFAENDMRRRFGWDFRQPKHAERLAKLERVRAVLTRAGRTLAQGALAWVWARSPLAVPVPGFKNLKQLEENVAATTFGPLSAEDLREIDAALQSEPGA